MVGVQPAGHDLDRPNGGGSRGEGSGRAVIGADDDVPDWIIGRIDVKLDRRISGGVGQGDPRELQSPQKLPR